MVESKDIANWLEELLAFRDTELKERQEFNNFTLEDNKLFEEKSACIREAIAQFKKDQLQNECSEKLMKLAADFDNYKKRVAKEKELDNWNFKKKFMLEVVNVLDDMERVLDACHLNELSYEPKENIDAITQGFMLIISNMKEMLKHEGCTQVNCKVGDEFDVNIHEAVSTISANESEVKDGQVAKVLMSGWMLDNKLLRAAKVVVCK